MLRPGCALLLSLLGTTSATAQGLSWDLPQRGALTFVRKTDRWQVTGPPSRLRAEWLIADAGHGGHAWRFQTSALGKAPTGFETPAFDDSAWILGQSEFGTEVGQLPNQRTQWNTGTLCLRTHVDFARRKPRAVVLNVDHDDGIIVWCNGVKVLENGGYGRDRCYVLSGPQLQPFTPGDNLIAVQCNNTGGAQYLDLALATIPTLPPGVKTNEDILKLLNEDRERGAQVYRDLFGGYRPPPMVLAGELDAAGQRLRDGIGDLREVGWLAGMDLQRGTLGGQLNLDAFRLYRLGDLHLRGRCGPLEADGMQSLEFTVKSDPNVDLHGESDRFVKMHVLRQVLYQFDGKLKIQRRLAQKDGKARVVELRTELSGRLFRGKDFKELCAELDQAETWTQATVHANQDTAFKAKVADALKRGTAHLRQSLANPNGWMLDSQGADAPESYHSGRLALGLLALVKGGVPRNDEVVQRLLAELRKRPLIDTYSLGNGLMALEAFYAPDQEWKYLQDGAIDRPQKRTVPEADRKLMETWTQRLLTNTDTRVDPVELLRFNYTRGERFDHSVNQYGLLGLYSAHLCGVTVPTTAWEAAANHLIAAQVEGYGKFDLDLVDYRTMARTGSDDKRTVSRTTTKAAGWSYEATRINGEPAPVWGSMTCAGITGLAICQAAMIDLGQTKKGRLQGDATAARTAGFAWLADNFSVRCHPGFLERQQHWFYYYLYGLERAALLSGIALIHDRDWYFEGAMVLCGAQSADGSWPGELHWDQAVERNAMAILFLKQSTLPVLTGK